MSAATGPVKPIEISSMSARSAKSVSSTSSEVSGAPKAAMFAWRLRWRQRQHDLATCWTTVTPGATPIAAFVTTFRLGAVWQHGEILLAYRTEDGGEIHLDLFDRVGKASTSTMKAGFMMQGERTSAARRSSFFFEPHNVRAIKLAPDTRPKRGFMLGQRRCFGHLDLRGQSADAVHDVISKAIQTRLHAEGFSYLKGAHCIGFANELLRDLQTLGESDTAKPVTFCEGQLNFCSRPKLGDYLSAHGFEALRDDLKRQDSAAREAAKPTVSAA